MHKVTKNKKGWGERPKKPASKRGKIKEHEIIAKRMRKVKAKKHVL